MARTKLVAGIAAAVVLAAAALLAVRAGRSTGEGEAPDPAAPAVATRTFPAPASPAPVDGLSPFQAAKAEALLHDRLPCLGCHRLDGRGGRIGPDLTGVGQRRTADWIRAKIADPAATLPGTLMPAVPMPDAWRDLLARYLAGRPGAPAADGGTPPAPAVPDGAAEGEVLYARHCAACHGETGRGDGWNAAHLPARPTVHADAEAMAARPDDVLYDAIHVGGYIMDRSPYMPPFGARLSDAEIRALVAHIRSLCRCQGPAWSRDGAAPPR